MSHPNHRDHKDAVRAKRIWSELREDEDSHIDELLAADQLRDHDRQIYQESAQLDDRGQDGGTQ